MLFGGTELLAFPDTGVQWINIHENWHIILHHIQQTSLHQQFQPSDLGFCEFL